MAEVKIILFWLAAICAAALIEPIKHKTIREQFEEIQITEYQTHLFNEMESLNSRIDTLIMRMENDSCTNELLINL